MKFEDLKVWQSARMLVKNVYSSFWNSKDYWFRGQVCGAALSIMNNIAEGNDRHSDPQLNHFLNIALGSANEVKSMLYVWLDLWYLGQNEFDDLYNQTNHISIMLAKFKQAIKAM